MHFRNLHIDNEYSAWRIYSCPNPIQNPEFMHLQLGKSFSSLEASSQMTTCFGFVLEHSWGFLFSSTFYLLSRCCNIAALTFLNPLSDSKSIVLDEDVGKKNKKSSGQMTYEGYSQKWESSSVLFHAGV
ncbi:hypothetical protein LOK49_LG12G01345 [Camellia lanceoleosa]|uniref:Uncharacterized protein n=1 Tax=Camellia lanceoleosa TaxID=1840588 RepID=A0ACC0FNX2_9ERIC|nr:hypothetical protein LOK49_LG12G01345 [Camellia lanceoleosa]